MEYREIKTEEERVDYTKIMRYCFCRGENHYEKLNPQKEIPSSYMRGLFLNKELKTVLVAYPFNLHFRQIPFKVFGVGNVGSLPVNRNKGYVRDLFQELFKEMKKKKIFLSNLFAFRFEFYERLGYCVADENILTKFNIRNIKVRKTNYEVKEVEKINNDIKKIHSQAVKNFDYTIYERSDLLWEKVSQNTFKFICYNEKKEPTGYLLLRILKDYDKFESFEIMFSDIISQNDFVNQVLFVKELLYINAKAKQTLLNFIWRHRDQVENVICRFSTFDIVIPYIKNYFGLHRSTRANSMIRIVDLENVLKKMNINEEISLVFSVNDEHCEWNNGFFLLSKDKVGKIKKEEIGEIEIIKIHIRELTKLLVGFRTIDELIDVFEFEISKGIVEKLRKIFPKTRNYLVDQF